MKHFLWLCVLTMAFACMPLASSADEPTSEPTTHASTGNLSVKTRTPAGHGVRCDLTLRGKTLHKTGSTDGDGVFVFVDIPPGDYELFFNAHERGASHIKVTLKAGDFPILAITLPE